MPPASPRRRAAQRFADSFRIVASGQRRGEWFGTGSATHGDDAGPDAHVGVPPLVREGDRYLATFTVRNTTERAMHGRRVDASSRHPEPAQRLAPQRCNSRRARPRDVAWTVVAPAAADGLRWDVACARRTAPPDRLAVLRQKVVPAYPVRVYQATLAQLATPLSLPLERPAGAFPGRGGIEVTLRAGSATTSTASATSWRRTRTSAWSRTCRGPWRRAMRRSGTRGWRACRPTRTTPACCGSSRPRRPGEDSLTAYVLSVADATG